MPQAIEQLISQIDSLNIAEDYDEDSLQRIATKCVHGYEIDLESRTEWEKQTKEGLKIAEQIMEKKTFPWAGAANIKFPLIATSAIQFAARAGSNVIQGTEIVKARVIGEDKDGTKADRAKRISQHMSWQITEKMEGWEEEMDQLLHSLPVVGTLFKKTYYCPTMQANRSDVCQPLDVVVHMDTKSLKKCRRVTHKLYLYQNDVIERERSGVFLDLGADYMRRDGEECAVKPELFLEQHCWYDLDGDGYEEPYIITIHHESQKLVRIVARYDMEGVYENSKGKIMKIDPVEYFTPFFFIPSPSGKFYALGFAHLLGPINESINTILNQLTDAGTLANMQGGFIGKGIRMRSGMLSFKPGEWKVVDVLGGVLKDNIVPMPVREPSGVLFNLLGLLNDTGMKLASVSETMTGEMPSQNTPATSTLAVIEQGLKSFSAIYKRVFRSLKQEFSKLHRLNRLYLDEAEYFTVLDVNSQVFRKDYEVADLDVVPVADPTLSSEAQRLARVEALMRTYELNPTPEGKLEILLQYYQGLQVQRIDKLLPMEKIQQMLNAPQPPDPELIKTQLLAVKQQHDYEMEKDTAEANVQKIMAEIDKIKAETMKAIADANSKPILDQLEVLNAQVAALHNQTKLEIEREKINAGRDNEQGNAGGAGGMAGAGNNQEGAGMAEGLPGSAGGPVVSGGDLGAGSVEGNSPIGGPDQNV